MGEEEDIGAHVVPNEYSHSKLKACMSCSLIKTVALFVQDGCDNCPFMSYINDRERVGACTTSQFVGTFVVMNPSRSWVAKWQRVGTLERALAAAPLGDRTYAISIDAKMPEDIVEQLEENRMRMHNVLATADKVDG